MSGDAEKTKRSVLRGYPGSGKTMLAIGLYQGSRRKGVSITVSDSKAREKLATYTSYIGAEKKFPLPTTAPEPAKGQEPVQSEREAYPFEIVGWRGEKFCFEIEDYAGERASRPDLEKEFVNAIIAKEPFGAVLLLNPGMGLFKDPRSSNDYDKTVFKLRSALPKSYTSLIEKLCEVGCKHFVLAVTASDRISKGGDLFQTEQHKNFKTVLKEIRDYLKSRLSVENKNKKNRGGNKLDYTVKYVTVTGRLKYDEKGNAQEVHLAKDSENTAADPFLWIIDPWRMRFRNLVKRLMWILPSSLLLFAAICAGLYAWNAYKIRDCLNQAENDLTNFGDPGATNFDREKGSNTLVAAENRLKWVNERKWLVADKDMQVIDERLPALLATLMTNQVWLAYYNLISTVDKSTYNDPHMTLKGQTELESWPYWARCIRGKVAYEAAKVFRDQRDIDLSSKVLNCTVQYLINEFRKLNDYGKQNDGAIKSLFEDVHSCSNDVAVVGNANDLGNLMLMRNICLEKWMKNVSDGISKNGVGWADNRISSVITKNTGLDREGVRKSIFSSHRDVELKAFKEEAEKYVMKVLDGDNDLQKVAVELFNYLSEHAKSPYKEMVLDAAQRRFNEAISTILKKEDNRVDLFEQIFHATRKLRNLGEKDFNEACFGDNALFWLAATITNENGVAYQHSKEWLCYDFKCDAVAVRTDHATNNPNAPVFKRQVDANMILSWQGNKRKVGGNWLIKNKSGENDWTTIPDSHVRCQMAANDILRIDVGPGEENWKWDINIPPFHCEFSPGWNNNKQCFAYKSKADVYPHDALYWVMLYNVHIENGPYDVFSKALKMANDRKDAQKTKRDAIVKAADAEMACCAKEKEGARHE